MATTIADVSNAGDNDGLLKDRYLDKRKVKAREGERKAENLRKIIFGPRNTE